MSKSESEQVDDEAILMNGYLEELVKESGTEDFINLEKNLQLIVPRAIGSSELSVWLRVQALNVTRHAAALRPFRLNEFGTDITSPSQAHIEAANKLIRSLRSRLVDISQQMGLATTEAIQDPQTNRLRQLLAHKDQGNMLVRAIEKIWDFYFELFKQRQTKFGHWLVGVDRIALDCYQVIYMGLGITKSIPTPAPFSYMETGFSPAAFRRGIPLSKLGKNINPFPLIQLPYHRLVNPWTLGAILHEVAHALQTDLQLRQTLPKVIALRLLQAGISPPVAKVWTRWHSEIFADLSGLLLGGPAMITSLMGTLGRSPNQTFDFSPNDVHPTPYLRIFINTELLRRMGFSHLAQRYNQMWQNLYSNPEIGNIPKKILGSFNKAKKIVVETVCFTPYKELGARTLAQVTGEFGSRHQKMIQEAGQRLALGNDPGIIPERFLIGASRWALEQRLAEPKVITQNFYRALSRR